MMTPERDWPTTTATGQGAKTACAVHKALALICSLCVLCLAAHPSLARSETEIAWHNQQGIVVVVGSPFVDVYVQPGRGYARFHVVEKNQRMRLFKKRGAWYKVETEDGKFGWVKQQELQRVYDTDGYLLDFTVPQWHEAANPVQFGLLGGTMNDAVAYNVYAGYRFTPNISAEIRYARGFGDFTSVRMATANLVHQPFPNWRYSPFFTLGAGALETLPDAVLVDAADEQDNVVSVGGGLMVYLSHKVVIRLEYNMHTMLTTRETNQEVEEWKAGLGVMF